MTIINTESLNTSLLTQNEIHQVYNGLDNCLTNEILEAEYALFNSNTNPRPYAQNIYNFTRALQAPYMEMMIRGFKVDTHGRMEAVQDLKYRIAKLQTNLDKIAGVWLGRPCNPRSRNDLIDLFYERLKLPEQWSSKKGEKKLSLDRHSLEKLYDNYLYARPLVSHILAIRDFSKQLEVFTADLDADDRFRSSYNIAGTETGRPSSSESALGSGGNAQNIAPNLRHVFCADPGYKLCVVDFEQSEARDVGYLIGCLFGDWSYLDACESGDVHTTNAKLIWKELPWTGNLSEDRQIASRNFVRDFSYRDMAKRGSHLTNYMGTAYTMARHLKITQAMAEDFQDRYCRGPNAAFPCIPRYWQWVISQIQTKYKIITPFGRERHFFGNLRDDTTAREAIAFIPQSTTSDRTNLGLWRVWKHLPAIQLLAQGYDSITFQAPDNHDFDDLVLEVVRLLRVPLTDPKSGRSYEVPVEAKVGYNWGARVTEEDQAKAKRSGERIPKLNERGLRKHVIQ